MTITINVTLENTNRDGSIIFNSNGIEVIVDKGMKTASIDGMTFVLEGHSTCKGGSYNLYVDLGEAVCIDTNEKTARKISKVFGVPVSTEKKIDGVRVIKVGNRTIKNSGGATFGWTCGKGHHRKAYAITYMMFTILRGLE